MITPEFMRVVQVVSTIFLSVGLIVLIPIVSAIYIQASGNDRRSWSGNPGPFLTGMGLLSWALMCLIFTVAVLEQVVNYLINY